MKAHTGWKTCTQWWSENLKVTARLKDIAWDERIILRDRQCTYNVKRGTEVRSLNNCCRGRAISITYSEWVSLAWVIQHAKRMPTIMLSFVACSSTFPHYLINGTIFGGGYLLNTKFVFWLSLQYSLKNFLILRRIQRDITIYVHRPSCKVPVILLTFQQNWIFPKVSKNAQISFFH